MSNKNLSERAAHTSDDDGGGPVKSSQRAQFITDHVERQMAGLTASVDQDLARALGDLQRIIEDRKLGRTTGSCEIENVINTLRRAERRQDSFVATKETMAALRS